MQERERNTPPRSPPTAPRTRSKTTRSSRQRKGRYVTQARQDIGARSGPQGPARPEESSVMAIRGIRIQGAIGWVAGAAIVAMALPAAASDGPSGPDANGRSTFKSG